MIYNQTNCYHSSIYKSVTGCTENLLLRFSQFHKICTYDLLAITPRFAPELRDLITESILSNNDIIQNDLKLLLPHLINQSLDMEVHELELAVLQPGTYNPAKFGRAYYSNESGLKQRNIRPFTIDLDGKVKRNLDHDDNALDFERCEKFYSKAEVSAKGSSNLSL